MIKHFNTGQSRWSLPTSDWPENPAQAPALFTMRKPCRKLKVLVDAELIDVMASRETLDKATLLLALLNSDVVDFYRYTNGLPPTSIEPTDVPGFPSPYPVYAGWAIAYPYETERRHWPVIYSRNPHLSHTVGGVRGNAIEFARQDDTHLVYTEFDPEQRAGLREMDVLALQVADQAVHADMFITHRPYLYSGSPIVSKPDTTVCTRDEAIPLISLYLRAQREFVLPTEVDVGAPLLKFRFNRGLYFWVGARELLPEAWRWSSACVQYSSGAGNDKLALLGTSALSRVMKALQERDNVHIALNQPTDNDSADEALNSLDNVLVSLMGALDITARVAHHVLNLPGHAYDAAWQRLRWRKHVEGKAPALAAVLDPGTPSGHTLTILRLLRNSVHGAALQGITYLLDGKAEMRIGLPVEDEEEILAAMDAMGGRVSWGVRSIAPGLNHIQPGLLVDRLFEEVIQLLNNLMKDTPVELLSHVSITADNSKPPVQEPSRGKFDTFSEWNRLAIRWQLGF